MPKDANPPFGGVGPRFSSAASTYDEHAEVQMSVAAGLLRTLEPLGDPVSILEIGCGTGGMTKLLLERFPSARLDALDLASGMIAEARRRVGESDRMRWFVGDARRHESDRLHGLIVSNCALHWLDPLEEALRRFAGFLLPGACLASSVMLHGTLGELHEARGVAAPEKLPPGRMPTLEELSAWIEGAGLRIEVLRPESVVTTASGVDRLLERLRSQGLTGGRLSTASLPLSRGELLRLREEYERRFSVPGGVRVTYEVAYVLARRPLG
jgi:malonyl-CoA O-methyltransferase